LLAAIGCGSAGSTQALATEDPKLTATSIAGHAPLRPESAQGQPTSRPQARTPTLASNAQSTTGAAATSPAPAQVGTWPLTIEPAALQAALASIPVLAGMAKGFKAFSDRDTDAALRRGGRGRDGILLYTFLPSAFAWSPTKGKTLWVLTGRSGTRALIAVISPLPGGKFSHAASTVIEEPDTTVALGYNAEHPEQLLWTTCYGCAGEGGTIRLREDGRVEFTYR